MTLETELTTRSMGGELRLLVASAPEDGDRAERDLRRAARRIEAWAQRLTRFRATSDLGVLNADPHRSPVALRPTIASVLSHARGLAAATEGTVDVTMLDARIAAETDGRPPARARSAWGLAGDGRHVRLIRNGPTRFDLDGVAKGWIADRALRLLDAYPDALVDADGDVAVRASSSADWSVAVAHPDDELVELARLRLPPSWPGDRFGVATSGTSVHRWNGPARPTHHLIDPLTRRPAATDVVQATVAAESAGLAEALAKSAVIRGSHDGCNLIDRAGAWGALLVLEDGALLATPATSRWLA
ncbi:MAG: FAD:protein FMN transferase [Chloroflexota bacterium]|jgi:thiamine biosynthesis lipoprotein